MHPQRVRDGTYQPVCHDRTDPLGPARRHILSFSTVSGDIYLHFEQRPEKTYSSHTGCNYAWLICISILHIPSGGGNPRFMHVLSRLSTDNAPVVRIEHHAGQIVIGQKKRVLVAHYLKFGVRSFRRHLYRASYREGNLRIGVPKINVGDDGNSGKFFLRVYNLL